MKKDTDSPSNQRPIKPTLATRGKDIDQKKEKIHPDIDGKVSVGSNLASALFSARIYASDFSSTIIPSLPPIPQKGFVNLTWRVRG